MLVPAIANLLLGEAEIVRWRIDWLCGLNSYHHDLPYDTLRTSFPVEGEHRVVESPGFENRSHTFEAVSLTDEWIDHVHFHVRVHSQVRERAWRSDVGEDEVIVVPDCRRALGREIRRAVGAHCSNEAKSLVADDPFHIVSQDARCASPPIPGQRLKIS